MSRFRTVKCGGYTAPRTLMAHDLAVWNKLLALPGTTAIRAKGTPTSVQSQSVSGVKFKFTFKDGSIIYVWQSWENQLSIVDY